MRMGERPVTHVLLEWLTLSVFVTEILIGVLIFFSFFDADFWTRIRVLVSKKIVVAFALLCLFSVLSIFWSFDKDVALQKTVFLIVSGCAFLLFVGFEKQRRLAYAFFASMTLQVVFAFVQIATGTSPASKFLGIAFHSASVGQAAVVESATGRILRAYGTLPHANILGGYLALATILALSVFLTTNKKKERMSVLIFLSIFLLGLLFTFSRSAILAAVVGCCVLLFKYRPIRQKRFLLLACVPFVVASLFFLPEILNRTTGQGRLESRSVAERVGSIRDGVNTFFAHPLFGIGAGQLQPAVYKDIAVSTEPAHVVVLQMAVELGLIGLFLALLCLWQIFTVARVSATGIAIFVAFCTISLFDHYLWTLWAGNLLFSFGILRFFEKEKIQG